MGLEADSHHGAGGIGAATERTVRQVSLDPLPERLTDRCFVYTIPLISWAQNALRPKVENY